MILYFMVACVFGMVVWYNLPQEAKDSRVQPWLTIICMLLWPSTLLTVAYLGIGYGKNHIEAAEDDDEMARRMLVDPVVALTVTVGSLFTLWVLFL